MKNEIVQTIPLWDLGAYLERHNLVIVPASLYWPGDNPHIETRRMTPLGPRDAKTD